MVLHRLTGDKVQIRGLSGLDLLTGHNDLVRHLQGFLLAGRVDGLKQTDVVCRRDTSLEHEEM
jgi:hypothetical protein